MTSKEFFKSLADIFQAQEDGYIDLDQAKKVVDALCDRMEKEGETQDVV